VLLGFAEALAAPEAAFSLTDAGYEVVLFSRRGSRTPLRRIRRFRLVEIAAPEVDVVSAVSELERLAETASPAVFMPLDDMSIWLGDRAFADSSIQVAGPVGDRAEFALDKRLQLVAAARAGFNVPETHVVESTQELLEVPLEFPVIVKPAFAARERGGKLVRSSFRVCGNRQDLEATARGLSLCDEAFLIQRRIEGTGRGVVGLADGGELRVYAGHRRIRMMNPIGSGSSAAASELPDEALVRHTQVMLAQVGWDGLFMVELLEDANGTNWFMELNGRAWGSLALSRRQGLEFAAWAVTQKLDRGFVPRAPASLPGVTCRHLGREILHLLFVLRGPGSSAVTNWPTRRDAVRGVCRLSRGDRWYNWRAGERGFFLADTVRTVYDQVAGR
jgi:hypothetical protein